MSWLTEFHERARSRHKKRSRDNILKISSRQNEKRFFIKYLFSKNLFSISEKRFSKKLSLLEIRDNIFKIFSRQRKEILREEILKSLFANWDFELRISRKNLFSQFARRERFWRDYFAEPWIQLSNEIIILYNIYY